MRLKFYVDEYFPYFFESLSGDGDAELDMTDKEAEWVIATLKETEKVQAFLYKLNKEK